MSAETINEDAGEPLDGIILTVRGDCGKTHSSIEEWQKCRICESILARRLRGDRIEGDIQCPTITA